MYQKHDIVTGGDRTSFYRMLILYMFHTISYFAVQPDGGLDIDGTCSCVSVNK
jgi:hypothetical protein